MHYVYYAYNSQCHWIELLWDGNITSVGNIVDPTNNGNMEHMM